MLEQDCHTFRVLLILLSCIKYRLVIVSSPSSLTSTYSARFNLTFPSTILSALVPGEYSCKTSKCISDSCSQPVLSAVKRTGSVLKYSQEALCSLMTAFEVCPRCSADVEEGRCHFTYEVPETRGTLFRSMICYHVSRCTAWVSSVT